MPDRFRTMDQAQEYLREIYPMQQFRILESEFGWVARPVLTQEEIEAGEGLGLGNYVIDKQTGRVSAHRSLPPDLIGEEYDQAIRSGQAKPGEQVYPRDWEVRVELLRESPNEVEYRVTAQNVTRPSEPPIVQYLLIDKNTGSFRTNPPQMHQAAREAASWAEALSRGWRWPPDGTFLF
ncbi:hypothetical protein ACTD5D_06375 [Nocardia takedensis]|uniref:hypothetical protein n=1 Tax=Nocardia takedensis TaxID=259390 RepID=UPI00068516D4|nr:hypothetical protein [Nocardia takedensis]